MAVLGSQLARADSPAAPIAETQATIKRLGFGLSQITLPAKAAKRLDIQTGEIRDDPSGRRVAPFSSIIYQGLHMKARVGIVLGSLAIQPEA
jgi:hypothetical protein